MPAAGRTLCSGHSDSRVVLGFSPAAWCRESRGPPASWGSRCTRSRVLGWGDGAGAVPLEVLLLAEGTVTGPLTEAFPALGGLAAVLVSPSVLRCFLIEVFAGGEAVPPPRRTYSHQLSCKGQMFPGTKVLQIPATPKEMGEEETAWDRVQLHQPTC